MSKVNWQSGLWRVGEIRVGSSLEVYVNSFDPDDEEDSGDPVCTLDLAGFPISRRRANANLIAAAPALYSLLEEIRDAALPEGSLWVDDIDTALAAARGEKKEVKP